MSLVDKLASKLKTNKSGESVSSTKVRNWAVRDSRPGLNEYIYDRKTAAGTFTGLILVAFLAIPFFFTNNASATSSSITVTIDDNVVDLNIAPTSSGMFSKSSVSKIGVSTTNYTGYTLSIVAGVGDNPTALINGDKSLTSISSPITEEQFKALDSTAYNNMWGYLPSNLCKTTITDGLSSTTCTTNTSFLPSPTTDGDILDITSVANSTVNEYEITLGTRVDSTASLGSYSNVFLVEAVANAIPYTITFVDNVVTDMPVDMSGTSDIDTVTISTNTPQRNGYNFIGWCTVAPTHNADGTDTCLSPGVQIAAGGVVPLDQTSSNNNFTLYAMWGNNYTIEGVTYMQDFATMDTDKKAKIILSMPVGQQYQLIDNRDNTKYWIAKQADGKVWMTQNLDLCVGCAGTAALTSDNTDLNTYGGGAYVTDYSMSNGVITWAPVKTGTDANSASPITSDQTITITSNNSGTVTWPDSNVYPWSAEAGSQYYYTSNNVDSDIPSTDCNTSDDYCKHYHVGNYYNWTEAIASSNSTNLSIQYMVAENSICPAGWRLPKELSSSAPAASTREFGQLLYATGVTDTPTPDGLNYVTMTNGAVNTRKAPLFLIRGGSVWIGRLFDSTYYGSYWSNAVAGSSQAYNFSFGGVSVFSAHMPNRAVGNTVRCLIR